jgi:hypothetical protein
MSMLAKTPYNEAWTMLEIAERAEATMALLLDRARLFGAGNLHAEITEGATATWLLVETFPNEEVRAIRNLARRRFGVFRPMQQRCDKNNPAKLLEGWQPVFPGWVLVFCFDVDRQWKRVAACPGVRRIIMMVDDGYVRDLGALNWVYDDRVASPGYTSARSDRTLKKAKKATTVLRKQYRQLKSIKKALKRRGKFESSTWAQASALAPHERIALFLRTLKAPSIGDLPH